MTILSAFAGLLGQGGTPLCAIARGRKREDEAARVMGNSFTLLMTAAAVLMILSWALLRPLLTLFGAAADTMDYAAGYLRIYIAGTPFVMVSLGMNGYINAQGFPRRGMMTVLLGAAVNIVLDPIFIFAFGMGVEGAALATVLAQLASALWCFLFLRGKRAVLAFTGETMVLRRSLVAGILSLGVTNFIMGLTNALIQAVANRQLEYYGGEIHLSAFVIISALRMIFAEIIQGFGGGMQPVLGYNYGAGRRDRVLGSIRFTALCCISSALVIWALFLLIPAPLVRLFTPEERLIRTAVPAMRIYYCGICFMALQTISQYTFLGLGRSKMAIVFSLLRKVALVMPAMLLLPRIPALGVNGVYWSEPISDLLGGGTAFVTMLLTVYLPTRRALPAEKTDEEVFVS